MGESGGLTGLWVYVVPGLDCGELGCPDHEGFVIHDIDLSGCVALLEFAQLIEIAGFELDRGHAELMEVGFIPGCRRKTVQHPDQGCGDDDRQRDREWVAEEAQEVHGLRIGGTGGAGDR